MDKYIGIDPGLDGAISIISESKSNIEIDVFDMPTISVQKGKKKGREFNIPSIIQILSSAISAKDKVHVFIEKVHSMPKQGVVSQFNFGVGYGILQGILAALNLETTFVTPQAWKKQLLAGMSKDKGASVVRALQLFPTLELTTARGKALDGRGDAVLIGYYGKLNHGKT